jgi:putative cell wall-binding protein
VASAGLVSHTYPANSITLLAFPSKVAATRVGGANRDATAAALALAAYPAAGSATAVVLARDDVYADGLTGAPLAAAVGGPLLLTGTSTLSADARSAIAHSLAPGGTIYLLGGPTAIAPQVASTLTALGYSVLRIGGVDRFATAALIADQLASKETVASVYLATGVNFPDAESAAAAAASQRGVVLLTDGPAMAPATQQWLATHPGLNAIAIGGAAASAAPAATAYVGADRYETAAKVAASVNPSPTGVVIATGANFPDGLAGAAYAAHLGWAMLLVSPGATGLGAGLAAYLHGAAATVTSLVTVGQTTAVPSATESQVLVALG